MRRLSEKVQVMGQAEIHRALVRMAGEILERNHGIQNLVLVGIRTGGAHLARRLKKIITKSEGEEPGFGIVDITLYRDDAHMLAAPKVGPTELETDINGKRVVLIDDVLYTGRTIRAAMDALIDFGRPKSIQLAVLIDRGLREFPIHADYIGRNIPTTNEEHVEVFLDEEGELDHAAIFDVVIIADEVRAKPDNTADDSESD